MFDDTWHPSKNYLIRTLEFSQTRINTGKTGCHLIYAVIISLHDTYFKSINLIFYIINTISADILILIYKDVFLTSAEYTGGVILL